MTSINDKQARDRRRLLRHLASTPAHEWETFAVLGERNRFPGTGHGSAYRIHLRHGSGRWWYVESDTHQRPRSPVVAHRQLGRNALPPDRVVHGGLDDLAKLDFDPDKPVIGDVLAVIRARLGIREPDAEPPTALAYKLGKSLYIRCPYPYCERVHVHGAASYGHRVAHCQVNFSSRGYTLVEGADGPRQPIAKQLARAFETER